MRRARTAALCPEPPSFSFAIVGRHDHPRSSSARANAGRRFVRKRIILAVTIAAALFGVVAAPALAQNSESVPAAAALMKSKSKTPPGRRAMVKVTNWREADLVELQVVESGSANW